MPLCSKLASPNLVVIGVSAQEREFAHLLPYGVDQLLIPVDAGASFVRRFEDNARAIIAVVFARAQADEPAELLKCAFGMGDESFVFKIVHRAGGYLPL